jgi:hypothetical protein
VTKQVVASKLQPGQQLDQWDIEPGVPSTIRSVQIIKRPGYRWNVVRIELEDGNVLRPYPTTGCKIGIRS